MKKERKEGGRVGFLCMDVEEGTGGDRTLRGECELNYSMYFISNLCDGMGNVIKDETANGWFFTKVSCLSLGGYLSSLRESAPRRVVVSCRSGTIRKLYGRAVINVLL